jgi:hypothetical protein
MISFKHYVLLFSVFIFTACSAPEIESNGEEAVTGIQLFELYRPLQTGLNFKTQGKILHPMDNTGLLSGGSGVAVGDINNDGLPDLFFSGGLNNSALFLNEGNLKFRDITQSAGIIDAGPKMAHSEGVNMVDINGDGFLDIYVLKSGLDGNFNTLQFNRYGANLLFINQGDNTFVEEGAKYGLDLIGLSQTANFFDYDADGDLDVYLVHTPEPGAAFSFPYYNKKPASPVLNDQFLENTGNRFVDVREKAGILYERNVGLSASVADVNNDGYPDIYVANDFFGRDFFYLNNGDKTFSEKLDAFFTKTPMSAMGSDFADINNDGWLDLFVGEMMPETHRRQKLNLVPFSLEIYNKLLAENKAQYTRNMLQINRGGTGFRDIGLLAGVYATEWSWSSFFFDADNDGFQDLFVANGIRRDMTNMDFIKSNYGEEYTDMADPEAMSKVNPNEAPVVKTENFMYRNKGDYTFDKMNTAWGMDQKVHTRGAIYADLDQDGDLDLILNNMDEGPFIYRNKAEQLENRHYLRLRLKARGQNTYGIGARADIYYQGRQQTHFLSSQKGFQSSPEPVLHIGLGQYQTVDSLIITWPGGDRQLLANVAAGQELVITQGEQGEPLSSSKINSVPLFVEKTGVIDYQHEEATFLDYRMERLLTRQYSREGPGIAVADVNGDELDDVFVGGAGGSTGKLFLQNAEGRMQEASFQPWANSSIYEDMGALFFDADSDGDPDLYLASGSNEYMADAPALEDRLFLNDGQGNFAKAETAIPDAPGYSSVVVAADFDQDGDDDLFVGGRMTPGDYASVPASRLLQNDGGNFSDVTAEVAPKLEKAGRITAALWTDADNDGDPDLAVVGEWMPFTIFYNQNGRLAPKAVAGSEGWWNSITGADVDNDGDIDYIAGNHGLNSIFKASAEEPLTLLSGDFDGNGRKDPLVFKYTTGVNAPFVNRDLFTSQMPYYNNRFYRFENYADARMENLFEEQQLKEAQTDYVYELRSMVFVNEGGKFKMQALPVEAQFGPIYGIQTADVNADGFLDLLVCGNSYSNHYEYGAIDALGALLLFGKGDGTFRMVDSSKSGLQLSQDAKSMAWMRHASGKWWLLIGNNNGPLQVYEWQGSGFQRVEGRKEERYQGSGYLSQSSSLLSNSKIQ